MEYIKWNPTRDTEEHCRQGDEALRLVIQAFSISRYKCNHRTLHLSWSMLPNLECKVQLRARYAAMKLAGPKRIAVLGQSRIPWHRLAQMTQAAALTLFFLSWLLLQLLLLNMPLSLDRSWMAHNHPAAAAEQYSANCGTGAAEKRKKKIYTLL